VGNQALRIKSLSSKRKRTKEEDARLVEGCDLGAFEAATLRAEAQHSGQQHQGYRHNGPRHSCLMMMTPQTNLKYLIVRVSVFSLFSLTGHVRNIPKTGKKMMFLCSCVVCCHRTIPGETYTRLNNASRRSTRTDV